jgi:3-demethoxyubiquinol 3-hydroxylase
VSGPWRPGGKSGRIPDSMIRVDQAGEYGATRIYAGQLAVLAPSSSAAKMISKMAMQEHQHLQRFNQLIAERRVRPTILQPLWNIRGLRAGRRNGSDQQGSGNGLHRRSRDRDRPALPAAARRARRDDPELSAISSGSRPRSSSISTPPARPVRRSAPAYPILTGAIRAACRAAIALSKRF